MGALWGSGRCSTHRNLWPGFLGAGPARGFLRWVCPRFPAAVGGGIPEAGGQFPPLPPAPASRACCFLELEGTRSPTWARHAGSRPAVPPTWRLWRVLSVGTGCPQLAPLSLGTHNRKSPCTSTWETLGPDEWTGPWASRVYTLALVFLPSL